MFHPQEWETSSGQVAVSVFTAKACTELQQTHLQRPLLPQLGMKHRGEGILRMEDAGTSEEEDTDFKNSNIPIDHGHLARYCLIKIIMPGVEASVRADVWW